jgi:hypothetical protein
MRLAFETVIEIISTPILQIKQKRRGARAPRREKQQKRLLIVGQQAREQEALAIKSAHTNAQEDVAGRFVSHSSSIITRNSRT